MCLQVLHGCHVDKHAFEEGCNIDNFQSLWSF